MKKIYLAGPITGCNWGESEDWRDSFKKLDLPGIQGFSPLRGKEYLKSETTIADNYSNTVMSSAKAIMTRDSFDVFSADAILVNFQGAKRVSIGTVMEIAWAWQLRKPVIAIVDDTKWEWNQDSTPGQPIKTAVPDLHDHSMLNEAISWKVTSLDDAVNIITLLFNP